MPQRALPILTCCLIALFLLFAPVSQVLAEAGNAHLHTSIDGYTIELVFPKGQPSVGPNIALVRILSAGGEPVRNATVQVAPVLLDSAGAGGHSHDASGHGSATSGGHADISADEHAGHNDTHVDDTEAPQADAAEDHGHDAGAAHIDTIMTQMEAGADAGSYTSVIHFDSAGAWEVRLQFNDAGVNHAARFAVMVAEPARDWRILGAFGGANMLVMLTAGVMKRRLSGATKATHRTAAARIEN